MGIATSILTRDYKTLFHFNDYLILSVEGSDINVYLVITFGHGGLIQLRKPATAYTRDVLRNLTKFLRNRYDQI